MKGQLIVICPDAGILDVTCSRELVLMETDTVRIVGRKVLELVRNGDRYCTDRGAEGPGIGS